MDEEIYNAKLNAIEHEREGVEKKIAILDSEIEQKSEKISKIPFVQKKRDKEIAALFQQRSLLCENLKRLEIKKAKLNQARYAPEKKKPDLTGIFIGAGIALVLMLLIIGGFASNLNTERNAHKERTTITERTTVTTTAPTTATTLEELKEVELLPSDETCNLEVGETDDDIIYYSDLYISEDDTEKYELKAVVDNPNVLKAEVDCSSGDICLAVTGVKPGKATVTVTGKDNKVTCMPLFVTVNERETEPPPTEEEEEEEEEEEYVPVEQEYVLNTNTKKIHYPGCSSVGQMSAKNKKSVVGTVEEFVAKGYDPCGRCNPH